MEILNGYGVYLNLGVIIEMAPLTFEQLVNRVKDSWRPIIYDYVEDKTKLGYWSRIEKKNPKWIPIVKDSKMHQMRCKYYIIKSYINDKCYRKEYDAFFDPDRQGLPYTEEEVDMWRKLWSMNELKEYLGIQDVGKWVMINISPNWKGKITQEMCNHLKHCIEQYYGENWYSEGKYVLETGGEGNFLHAHCMFRWDNSPRGKQVQGHLKRHNHAQQIIKYFNKVKGFQGLVKGKYAIQLTRCNSREMVLDKLDYLIEAKKPEGHKNLDVKGIKGLNTKIDL